MLISEKIDIKNVLRRPVEFPIWRQMQQLKVKNNFLNKNLKLSSIKKYKIQSQPWK